MSDVLVNEYRGSIIENVRRGYICVVDKNKEIIFNVGDPDQYAFYRSTSKPIQILPILKRNLDLKYNFTEQQTVIMASSHNGESYHVHALEEMQAKAGLIEMDMVVKPMYPLDISTTDRLTMEGKPQRKMYHPCSGKHTAFMLLAREYGPDYQNYEKIDHPAQQEVLETIAYMADLPKNKVEIGMDNCGSPAFAVPLKNMAISYLKLACPDLVNDTITRRAIERFTPLVNRHNKFIRGTGRLCTLMNEDENIIFEDGGFGGIFNFGLKRERIGVAIKIEDGFGNDKLIAQIVMQLLTKLNYDRELINKLKSIYSDEICMDADVVTGKMVTEF